MLSHHGAAMRPMTPAFEGPLVDGGFNDGDEDDEEEEAEDDGAEDEPLRLGSELLRQIKFSFLEILLSFAGMNHGDYSWRREGGEKDGGLCVVAMKRLHG